jgi:hypothetical protein
MVLFSVFSFQLVGMQKNNFSNNADDEYDVEVKTFLSGDSDGSSSVHSCDAIYLQIKCDALKEQFLQYQYEYDQMVKDYNRLDGDYKILYEKYRKSVKERREYCNMVMNLNALVVVLKRDIASLRAKNDDIAINDE